MGCSGPHRALPALERNLCSSSESWWKWGVPGGIGWIPAMWAMPRKGQREHGKRGVTGALGHHRGSGSGARNLPVEIQESLLGPGRKSPGRWEFTEPESSRRSGPAACSVSNAQIPHSRRGDSWTRSLGSGRAHAWESPATLHEDLPTQAMVTTSASLPPRGFHWVLLTCPGPVLRQPERTPEKPLCTHSLFSKDLIQSHRSRALSAAPLPGSFLSSSTPPPFRPNTPVSALL